MITSVFAVTTAQLVSYVSPHATSLFFGALFLVSEVLGSNSKIASNSVYQFLLGYLKNSRNEDDKINEIKEILKK